MRADQLTKMVTLTWSEAVADDYGHLSVGEPVPVLDVWANVQQMSASKTMMTFQQADIVGVEIAIRTPSVNFNGILLDGREVHFSHPDFTDRHGRWMLITGYYQMDNPR